MTTEQMAAVTAAFRRWARSGTTERRSGEQDAFTLNLLTEPTRAPERRAVLSAQIGPSGGYMRSPGIIAGYEAALKFFGAVRQLATVARTEDGSPYIIATADDTANEGDILAENTAFAEDVVTVGRATIFDRKFTSKIVLVPHELFEDAGDTVDGLLSQLLGERVGRRQNRYFTVKLLASAPVGRTAASATAISYTDVRSLIHSVDAAYRLNGSFMCHPDAMLYLRGIVDDANRPLFLDGEGRTPTFAGYPVVANIHMDATLASGNKSLTFGDHSRFCIRDVRSVQIRRLAERFRDRDQIGFIATHRADGELVNASAGPVKHLVH